MKAESQAENRAHAQEGNQVEADAEAKWGFLKNIVNIDSFFASGAQKGSSKTHKRPEKKTGQAPGSLAQKKSQSASTKSKKTNSEAFKKMKSQLGNSKTQKKKILAEADQADQFEKTGEDQQAKE